MAKLLVETTIWTCAPTAFARSNFVHDAGRAASRGTTRRTGASLLFVISLVFSRRCTDESRVLALLEGNVLVGSVALYRVTHFLKFTVH